jgi:predicted transcriptional regulator of viral defense system
MRVVRPIDLADQYTNPAAVLRDQVRRGRLKRIAHGIYVAPPDDALDPEGWAPTTEDAAGAVAVAEFGEKDAVAMGMTAARLHGYVPRPRARADIAAPRRHRDVELADRPGGTVHFVVRDVEELDAHKTRTALGHMLVTSIEQTLVDLVTARDREDADVVETVERLAHKADWRTVDEIARSQRVGRRGLAALRRLHKKTGIA